MRFEMKSGSDKPKTSKAADVKEYEERFMESTLKHIYTPEFKAFIRKANQYKNSKEIYGNLFESARNSKINERNQRIKGTYGAGDLTVLRAQASLVMAGYDLGGYGVNGVDGDLGSRTLKAIAEFKKTVGLGCNDKLDGETIYALDFITEKGFTKSEIELIGKEARESLNPEAKKELKADGIKVGDKTISEEAALEKLLRITIGHEAPQKFQTAGNPADGMALSYGIFQWNIGMGTFQKLLRDFDQRPENEGALEKYLGTKKAQELRDNVLSKTNKEGLKWALQNISEGKAGVKNDWKTALEKLGAYEGMKKIQAEYGIKDYIKPAFDLLNDLGLEVTDRGLAVANDIKVQGGGLYYTNPMTIDGKKVQLNKDYYLSHLNDSMSYQEKLVTIIALRASACNPEWTRNFAARKIHIATGYGYMNHGKDNHLVGKPKFKLDSQEILDKELGKTNNYLNWIDQERFQKVYQFEDKLVDKEKFETLLNDIDKVIKIIDQMKF